MEIQNELGHIIDKGNGRLADDACAKQLFSLKQVVGYFLKECLREYRGCSLEKIVNEYLNVNASYPVCDEMGPEYVKRLGTELILPHDDILHLDLVFEALTPAGRRQIVEIEVQKDARRLDKLIGRGMLYSFGIGASEYNMVFRYPDYERLEKVHSIWICPASPKSLAGRVEDYYFKRTVRPSADAPALKRERYDKMQLTAIYVHGDVKPPGKCIQDFVWTLTTNRLSFDEKKRILKENYNMNMTKTMDESVEGITEVMLNWYGQDNFRKDLRHAKALGIKEAREKSRRAIETARQEVTTVRQEITTARQETEQLRHDIVVEMLQSNRPLEKIQQCSRLSLERIRQIAAEHNLEIRS